MISLKIINQLLNSFRFHFVTVNPIYFVHPKVPFQFHIFWKKILYAAQSCHNWRLNASLQTLVLQRNPFSRDQLKKKYNKVRHQENIRTPRTDWKPFFFLILVLCNGLERFLNRFGFSSIQIRCNNIVFENHPDTIVWINFKSSVFLTKWEFFSTSSKNFLSKSLRWRW